MKKNNIGIVGQGFVGSAIREGLKDHHNVFTYDIDKKSVIVHMNKYVKNQKLF